MATKFANDSINKYHQAASDDLYDFLRPKSYIESYRNMAYKDPWFALGEFLGREYIGNYNRRGTEKATTAAQEFVDSELNNITNPPQQQQAPQPSVQMGNNPTPATAVGLSGINSYTGTAPTFSIGTPTVDAQQATYQKDVNSYDGQSPALGLQQAQPQQQAQYIPKSPDQLKAQYWSQQRQAGRPDWQIRQGWDNVKDSLTSYTQKYNNNRVDDIIAKNKETIFGNDDVAASNVVGNIAKYDPTKAQMIWESRNNRIKMAHENDLYSMRYAGSSGGRTSKASATGGLFNYHDVTALEQGATRWAGIVRDLQAKRTDVINKMNDESYVNLPGNVERLQEQLKEIDNQIATAERNRDNYSHATDAITGSIYFGNPYVFNPPAKKAGTQEVQQQTEGEKYAENLVNELYKNVGLNGEWTDAKVTNAIGQLKAVINKDSLTMKNPHIPAEHKNAIRIKCQNEIAYLEEQKELNRQALKNKK